MIKLMQGDCLELMGSIPSGSVDMVLCDLPYGVTQAPWDVPLDLAELWRHYKRICKENAAVVLFSQIPFSVKLAASNLQWLRYEWIWRKTNTAGFLNANKMPLKAHEQILVFYKRLPTYNPQYEARGGGLRVKNGKQSACYGGYKEVTRYYDGQHFYPVDILTFSNSNQRQKVHPTEKPVPLLEYLVRTYTDAGQTVLDNCMGGGSCGVACVNTGRSFIGIEVDKGYFKVAEEQN